MTNPRRTRGLIALAALALTGAVAPASPAQAQPRCDGGPYYTVRHIHQVFMPSRRGSVKTVYNASRRLTANASYGQQTAVSVAMQISASFKVSEGVILASAEQTYGGSLTRTRDVVEYLSASTPLPPRRFAHFQAGSFGEWVTGDYGYLTSNCRSRHLGTVTAQIPGRSEGIKVWVDRDANR